MKQILIIMFLILSVIFGLKQLEIVKYNSREISECVRDTELEKNECKMLNEKNKKEDF